TCYNLFYAHRDLHSFPPRRSSDLTRARGIVLFSSILVKPVCIEESQIRKMKEILMAEAVQNRCAHPKCTCPVGEGEQYCSQACSDRKSTRLNSSHRTISYAVFCLK